MAELRVRIPKEGLEYMDSKEESRAVILVGLLMDAVAREKKELEEKEKLDNELLDREVKSILDIAKQSILFG